MRKTDNYGLSLYDSTDKMSITAEENSLNANMEIIDKTLNEVQNSAPTKTSELENDSGFITADDIPAMPTVPTKTSELENDSGFVDEDFVNDAINDIGNVEISDEKIAGAVQGWLDEHPEATTTVADGSISREKLNFNPLEGELSSNLVDETKLTSARFTDTKGSLQTFTEGQSYYNSWRLTDYIDVSQHIGDTITADNIQGYCFYDESKTKINGSGYNNPNMNKGSDYIKQFVIPEGVHFVRFSYWLTVNYQANFGETLDSYSPYGSVLLPKNIVKNKNIGEKISIENIENEKLPILTVCNDLIDYGTLTPNVTVDTSGNEVAATSSLAYRLSDYIPVKPNTRYSYKAVVVYSFTEDKSYERKSSDANEARVTYLTTTNSTAYVRVLFKNAGIQNQTVAYFVEGDRPDKISTEKSFLDTSYLKDFSVHNSVLNRMGHLFNPTVKTTIGFIGDSNTAGLVDNSYTYHENCWANLLVSKINTMIAKERYIKVTSPYVTAHVGEDYQGSCWIKGTTGFVNFEFYGETCKVYFTKVDDGAVMVLTVDDGEPIEVDTSTATSPYEIPNLTEAPHFLKVTAKDTKSLRISGFTVRKYVEAVNRGVSGESTGNLASKTFTDDISVVVFGTNDRASGSPETIKTNLIDYVKKHHNAGRSVILISPTPAADDFETGASDGLKMCEIDSIIASACSYLNFEHISLYQYLLDYCDYTDTDLSTMFKDRLHITEPTHKLVYTYLCGKLGLGRDIEDYLTTT